MSSIVPRWEWRNFADRRRRPNHFAAQAPERVQESDEIYLLSARGTDTVKVRDDLMDVKHLRVGHNGLEQWVPVMKAASRSRRATSRGARALGVESLRPAARRRTRSASS